MPPFKHKYTQERAKGKFYSENSQTSSELISSSFWEISEKIKHSALIRKNISVNFGCVKLAHAPLLFAHFQHSFSPFSNGVKCLLRKLGILNIKDNIFSWQISLVTFTRLSHKFSDQSCSFLMNHTARRRAAAKRKKLKNLGKSKSTDTEEEDADDDCGDDGEL